MILINVDFITYPFVQYPTLEAFLDRLDIDEPLRHWREVFLLPLQRLGVRTLDDMTIVSPEAIYVFCKLSPIAIMDLYVHVVETIDALHCSHGISGAWRTIISKVNYLFNLVTLYWQHDSTTRIEHLVNENNVYHSTYSLGKYFGCSLWGGMLYVLCQHMIFLVPSGEVEDQTYCGAKTVLCQT